jgi:hypothetical protein
MPRRIPKLALFPRVELALVVRMRGMRDARIALLDQHTDGLG